MQAVAHGWKKPGGGGPSKNVAEEFVRADTRRDRKKQRMKKLDSWAQGKSRLETNG